MNKRHAWRGTYGFAALAIAAVWLSATGAAQNYSGNWTVEWPKTDFSKTSVDFADIFSGGPSKDGIPSIDDPIFVSVSDMTGLSPTEPVVGLTVNGVARAYPLRILTWHEIVNDVIGGVPVMVTYCPLCNTAIAFDRRIDGRAVEFGTTGKLRKSNLIMYDRETESWWQQMVGEGIVGARTGVRLKALPTRLESWERFKTRNPDGKVLIPNNPNMRPYGANPYVGYDGSSIPFLYAGDLPKDIAPMAYVVAVANQAWSLDLLRREGKIEKDDLVLTWEPGQNSVLDTRAISEGRDIGNVIVQRRADNALQDISYDVTFAFVFYAFQPEGTLFR